MQKTTSTAKATSGLHNLPERGEGHNQAETAKKDIRQTITDKMIALLENGVAKWRASWSQAAQGGMPHNGKTGQPYRGINVLLLWNAALESQYTANVWLTYRQAAEMGAQVRKAEKGTQCVYFDLVKKPSANGAQDEPEFYPLCKAFWLFNVAQIEGLPDGIAGTHDDDKTAAPVFQPIELAEQVLSRSGADIAHGYDGAYYSRGLDMIALPNKEQFFTPENYCATALHELTHWTDHEARLNRAFGKRFGDDAYAMEELVAEIGAAFLGGHIGFIDATIEGHAAYLDNWLAVLKRDKHAIFTACKQASLAYELLIDKAGLQIGASSTSEAA